MTGRRRFPSRPLARGNLSVLLCCAIAFQTVVVAQSPPSTADAGPVATTEIAATVNGESLTTAEVSQLFQESFRGRKIADDALPALQAQALLQAIDQRLVAQYLRRSKQGVSDQEVNVQLDQFKQLLEIQKQPLADFLERQQLTEDALRRKIYWQMSWRRYIARHVTDEILQRRFDRDRKHFDGGEIRVSHLLLKPPGDFDLAGNLEKLRAQANTIRDSIEKGELTFAQAVEQYSQGTKENGGDLGFISRRGSMPEAFCRAAFDLNLNQVSVPVASNFGVHLIQCTEIKPGNKTLDDVRESVELAVIQDGFRLLANQERKQAQIEFSGKWPYLHPDSGELIVPPSAK